MMINKEGEVTASIWDSPAFKAGIDIGTQVQGVNGEAFSPERIKAAILAAKTSKEPIHLLVKNGTRFRDLAIDYHGGPRYPRLQKVGNGDGGLDKLLMPR
jgi:predicted metalloprotease with PDZ domain